MYIVDKKKHICDLYSDIYFNYRFPNLTEPLLEYTSFFMSSMLFYEFQTNIKFQFISVKVILKMPIFML